MLLQPMSQTDVFYSVDVFFCLPTFQLLCFLVLPNYKTQRPPGAEQSSEYFTIVITSIPPTTHMLCVCECVFVFCVRVIYASHSILIAILWKQYFWFDCNSKKWPLYCPQGSGTLRQQYTLLYSVILCFTLLYSALLCLTLLYTALHCSTLLYSALLCFTLLYSALLCSVMLYSALLCSTLL